MEAVHYREDWSTQKPKEAITHRISKDEKIQNIEDHLLEYVLNNCPPNDPQKAIDAIDEFCFKYWMMNLGPEKAEIVLGALKKIHPKVLVEIGGYCGYSALTFAANTPADTAIYTVEVNEKFAGIARKILDHAGVGKKVTFFIGDVQAGKDKLKALGHIDFLFVDHIKDAYLSDFKIIESLGVIQTGSVVVGDNIIQPGAPDYLQHFKERKDYNSVLYHTYIEYWTIPDGVLVSVKQ
jgi:catechol O-methyltransferase